MKKQVIIVAGGHGVRMGSDIPKQFLLLNGKPLLMHTVEAFYYYDSEINIILVLPEDYFLLWKELREAYRFRIAHRIVSGGSTRFHSVQNALPFVEPDSIVAVHDGDRPLISREVIAKAYLAMENSKAACPVIPLTDSLRVKIKNGTRSVNRNNYFLVQTPQIFHSKILLSAYLYPYQETFTDDISVVEFSRKCPVTMIEGSPENIKITTPVDLATAEAILKSKCPV
ncbi:MAG: 2-C-methyl-D-erythritol 4-phosphate cytidylyltransferase [Candidatus Symbiothrix sp.]|jgi:2-C-methyl-D-erythritol 4-phosphate cytidylyltransferase|nr:2-C-methyl-D-erythritol 4-phosphate cytidylyltransferase [Candidatus Symbiothrix sp.]